MPAYGGGRRASTTVSGRPSDSGFVRCLSSGLTGRAFRVGRSDGDRSSARILSGTPSQYYDVPSALDLPLDVGRPHMTFPSDGGSAAPFAFPGDAGGGHRQSKKVKMTFPDRTGTGGLRAELDEHGNYKGVYYASGAVKFVDDRDVRNGNGPGSRPKFQFPKFV